MQNLKPYFILFFTFLSIKLSAQFENMSQEEFLNLSILNQKIPLDENFDSDIVNFGVLHFTNIYRKKKNKPTLAYNTNLEKSAFIHSGQMKKYNFFDHINRKNRSLKDLDDRADAAGYKNYAELSENLYYGFIDLRNIESYKALITKIVEAFKNSKPHNENLLNKDLKEMGAAIVFKEQSEDGFLYYYFTQSFGTQFNF